MKQAKELLQEASKETQRQTKDLEMKLKASNQAFMKVQAELETTKLLLEKSEARPTSPGSNSTGVKIDAAPLSTGTETPIVDSPNDGDDGDDWGDEDW